jgi:uncharacterized membrane protein YdbT with pleckstrin-like domain
MKALPFGLSPLRPSMRYMLICTAHWLVLSLSCSVGALLLYPLLIIASWLALLAFFYHVFWLCAELYVITPEMFMVSKGLLNKTVTWLSPPMIRDFEVKQSKLMRFLGILHVTVISTDDLRVQLTFNGVDVSAVKSAVTQLQDLLKSRREFGNTLPDEAGEQQSA